MQKKEVLRYLVLRTIGNFLVLFMVFGFFATFGPALYYEVLYRYSTAQGIRFAVAQTQAQVQTTSELGKVLERYKTESQQNVQTPTSDSGGGLLSAILSGKKEQILLPKSAFFSVVIPKIGANEQVTPNVDPSNEQEYLSVLQHSIAHAKGSAFPGLNGTTYLFAHSADNFWNVGRYNAVFYLLKELSVGDDVVVFYLNKRYDYTVYDSKIVEASDVSHLASNIGQGERLILQTCWPPGTSWKRMLIFAKPKTTD